MKDAKLSRFGVHGDCNHIGAILKPAHHRTPLKGDKRCNLQKEPKRQKNRKRIENRNVKEQTSNTFLLNTFSSFPPDHIQ